MSDEPDEALIWAREQPASLALPVIRMARAYRAGQAASAERIKALEGLLNHAEDLFDWAAQSDCENGVRSLNKAAAATYLADAPATKAAILEIRELTRALHVKEPTHD